jgi:PAS domain S-box-containing protein
LIGAWELEEKMNFETGSLTSEEIEAIFNNLPIDITFVGKDDTVRYFSQTKGRIFKRAKTVIGKTVQNCHPQKSIDKVNKIVMDFKSKKRNTAEFWINMQGKMIYIRYFAIRDSKGEYMGTMEITQNITDIQKIKDEKRLMD